MEEMRYLRSTGAGYDVIKQWRQHWVNDPELQGKKNPFTNLRRDSFFADGYYHFENRQEMFDFMAADEYEAATPKEAWDAMAERHAR